MAKIEFVVTTVKEMLLYVGAPDVNSIIVKECGWEQTLRKPLETLLDKRVKNGLYSFWYLSDENGNPFKLKVQEDSPPWENAQDIWLDCYIIYKVK